MHDDEEPVDLSSLDPARDRPRWDRLVAATAARARARRRPSFARELVRRGVPAIALAAAAAAAVWLARPAPPAAPAAASARTPADVIESWAYADGADPRDLLSASTGGDHVDR